MHDGPVHVFVDGAVRVLADSDFDHALLDVGHCYTTTRVRAGEPLWPERHAHRLARDAKSQGLPVPEPASTIDAMRRLARAEFDDGDGVVRLQLGCDTEGSAHLVGVPRPLGDEPAQWRLGIAPTVHPGPGARAGAKLLGLPFIDEARAWLSTQAFDEALFFDVDGLLVEGTRSNLIVVDAAGRAVTPALELGPVAGIGIEASLDVMPAIRRGRLSRDDVAHASEIIAINAVRGACPCLALDSQAIGSGAPGPVSQALASALEDA